LTKVGRSVDGVVVPDHYATYAYGPNGEILSEVRNPTVPGNSNISVDAAIQLSYAYDSPGLLKSLEAKTGSRTRFIETLAHSDAPPGFKTYDGRIGHSSQGFAPKSTDSLKTLELGYTYYPEGGLKLVQAGGNFTAGPLSPTAFRYALDMKDANQNLRIARQGDEPSYHYNVKPGNDQLVSVTLDGSSGPVKSAYTYDANGNVVSKTHHINNITYDPFYNKASSILHEAQGPQQSYSMRYGGMLGERVWQTYYDGNKNTVLENTYFRGLNAYPLVIQYDNAPTPQQRTQMNRKTMIWGPTGLIAVNDFTYATGASSDHFVIPDHRGSTVMVLQKGSFDATVQTYAYTPTGNVYKGDGTLVTSAQPVPYLFQGQEYDWQSELHNYRARFYDSDMMMFLSPDPSFRVGESPYVAMGNDPVNNADPDGRTWLPKRSMSPVSSPSAGMR
jgi:RHS repeat-associated protein